MILFTFMGIDSLFFPGRHQRMVPFQLSRFRLTPSRRSVFVKRPPPSGDWHREIKPPNFMIDHQMASSFNSCLFPSVRLPKFARKLRAEMTTPHSPSWSNRRNFPMAIVPFLTPEKASGNPRRHTAWLFAFPHPRKVHFPSLETSP